MYRIVLVLVLSLSWIAAGAQLSFGQDQHVRPAHDLTVVAMPNVDNASLKKEELNKRTVTNRAPIFAHSIPVDINPQNVGRWEFVGDKAIWRVVLESKTAYSLNLGFSEFYLPHEAALYIYDFYGQERISPFVSADNDAHEQLWTPIFSTDKLVIEINIPKAKINALRLQLSHVNHDFLDLQKSLSDDCHIDVGCNAENGFPDIDNYRDQIRSVGLYTIAGTSICTGFLINNTREDCTPYFMTAYHCNLNASNAASMVTYWNYENSQCRVPGSAENGGEGDGNLNTFNSGAKVKATWQESDFTLVELDDEVPESANAYFCGWDITDNSPDRGVVIHHPNLEEKRVSFTYNELFVGEWGQETAFVPNGKHLVVDHWDLGSTEDGSSGAPLLNRQGLVIGQLHGGLAKCGNQDYDAFGRLFSSWTGGALPNNRLKDWLDPDNIGALKLAGKNCVFGFTPSDNDILTCTNDGFFTIDVAVDNSFQGQVQLTFEALPQGASAFYANDIIAPGQETRLTVANLGNLASGEYGFDIVARDGQNERKTRIRFEIFAQNPLVTNLLSPAQNSSVIIDDLVFSWADQELVEHYNIQLASDIGFTTELIEREVFNTFYPLDLILNTNQEYYWRVRAVNPCGESPWSQANQFTTIAFVCTTQLNTQIEEIGNLEPSVIFSKIRNTTAGNVTSVSVTNIVGVHSFVSDLRMSLISPAGTEVALIRERCSSSEDFDLGFSDDGIAEISCPPTDKRTYKPLGLLATFNGESGVGDWTLKVQDINKFDGGTLLGWALSICVDPATDYSLSADVDSLLICTNESYTIPLILGAGYDATSNLIYESDIPDFAVIETLNGATKLRVNSNAMSSPGEYLVGVSVTDDQGHSAMYYLAVQVISTPSSFEVQFPLNKSEGIAIDPTFIWASAEYASSYFIEIAKNVDFSDLVLRDTISENAYSLLMNLESDQTYYWRIQASNRCGMSSVEIVEFKTEMTNAVQNINSGWLDIYPNPASSMLYIAAKNGFANKYLDIEIHSLDGKVLLQKEQQSSRATIPVDLGKLSPGIYLISVKYQSQVQMSRIVVQ